MPVVHELGRFSAPADRLACDCITVLSHLDQSITTVYARHIVRGETVSVELRAHAFDELRRIEPFDEVADEIWPLARETEKSLDTRAALLNCARDTLLPVDPDPDRGEHTAIRWVTAYAPDPLFLAEPTHSETQLIRALGLVDTATRMLMDWYRAYLEASSSMDPELRYQLHRALYLTLGHLCQLLTYFVRASDEKEELEQRQSESREEARARIQAHLDNMIVLGETQIPPQYTVLGRTEDGRYVSISQNQPQFVLVVGRQGTGKSHVSILILESCEIPHFGLSQFRQRTRNIRFFADWHAAVSKGDQVRAGFFANPYVTHWETLKHDFNVERKNFHLRGGVLLCLPESLDEMNHQFADLRERGLQIQPIRIHPRELGLFGYSVYLNGGAENPRQSSEGRRLVRSIISDKGEDITPAQLRAELQRHKLDSRVRDVLLMQLSQLDRLVSTEHHLMDHLDAGSEVIVYMQGRFLSADQVLPLEVALINAFSRPLRNGQGDPPRWIHIDEIVKHLANEATIVYLSECVTELRHRPISYFVSGQRVDGLPKSVMALPTVWMVFGISSQAEFRKGQDWFPPLRGRRYEEVRDLRDHHAIVGAVRSNDGRVSDGGILLHTRPTLIMAGGETFTYAAR